MKLINVKNEKAVARVLTHVRMFERYLSLTHSVICSDMSPLDAENMITFKKWSSLRPTEFPFTFFFHLPVKQGMAIWSANCRLNSDYYHITVDDVSFKLTKLYTPDVLDVGVDCEFGFLAFCAVPRALPAFELLQGAIDECNVLFEGMCEARTLAEQHGAKIKELTSELEDFKQQLADVYWSTQN